MREFQNATLPDSPEEEEEEKERVKRQATGQQKNMLTFLEDKLLNIVNFSVYSSEIIQRIFFLTLTISVKQKFHLIHPFDFSYYNYCCWHEWHEVMMFNGRLNKLTKLISFQENCTTISTRLDALCY